jgi:hypothetical protein
MVCGLSSSNFGMAGKSIFAMGIMPQGRNQPSAGLYDVHEPLNPDHHT